MGRREARQHLTVSSDPNLSPKASLLGRLFSSPQHQFRATISGLNKWSCCFEGRTITPVSCFTHETALDCFTHLYRLTFVYCSPRTAAWPLTEPSLCRSWPLTAC